MTEPQDRMMELLAVWEEKRQQGATPTPEELCPDDPDLQHRLRQRIERRLKLLVKMEPATIPQDGSHAVASTPPTLPGYVLDEVLGSGGMGVVYKARQVGLNRTVAVKMVLAGVGSAAHERARFRSEAETVAKLKHPNIVQIHEVREHDGRPFLVLEYAEAGSLADLLTGTPMSAARSAMLIVALAGAVHHAHQLGIVHRDLKPANILLTSDGTPKVADFGLAKRLDDDASKTRTGTIMGTPHYMAPEQALGRIKEIGPTTDVYALGVILYEMLTGRVPFVGETILETLEQVRTYEPVPPRQLVPKLPRDLETICLKCLEKDPKRRYPSARDLADDLHAFLSGEAIKACPDTLLSQIGRAVGRFDRNFAHFRGMSRILLSIAAIPAMVHFGIVFGLHERPNYPQLALLISMATITTVQSVVLWGARDGLKYVPARLRRHTYVIWNAYSIASGLCLFTVWWNCPADRPDLLLLAYPVMMAMVSVVFFSFAAEIGIFFVAGSVALAATVPMALFPMWSPIGVGLFMTCNITGQGLFFRWLAQQADAARDDDVSASGSFRRIEG
jgi:serine/threonine protein kinase